MVEFCKAICPFKRKLRSKFKLLLKLVSKSTSNVPFTAKSPPIATSCSSFDSPTISKLPSIRTSFRNNTFPSTSTI